MGFFEDDRIRRKNKKFNTIGETVQVGKEKYAVGRTQLWRIIEGAEKLEMVKKIMEEHGIDTSDLDSDVEEDLLEAEKKLPWL